MTTPKRGGYTPGSYWMERRFFDGRAPEHLRTRGERWPIPVKRMTVTALLLHTYVGRGVRPAMDVLSKAHFDVPFYSRAVVTQGPYAGNEVLFYMPTALHPEGTEDNPSPEDFGISDPDTRWLLSITGAMRRYKGYFYTAYVNDPCVIERLDTPAEMDW